MGKLVYRQHGRAPLSTDLGFTQVKGHDAISAMRPALIQLAHRTGQSESIDDLSYFLEKPGLMRRSPRLVLMHESSSRDCHEQAPQGALLVQEFRPFGCTTGVFATTDRSGRGVLLGDPEERLRLALRAADHLMRSGAKMVLMTVQCDAADSDTIQRWGRSMPGTQWSVRNREQHSHLQLEASYEQTLATMGQKTRANLRYYRRRAESELCCRFIPQAAITQEELIALNRESSFPLPERVLLWRYKVQSQLRNPYFMGLQDGEGRWLSVIAGRRFGTSTEILWQLNRAGLQRHSLVTALRSYQLEHEIACGMQRFYVEGGTNHSMQNSFETVPTTDIVMLRSNLRKVMSGFARRYVSCDNLLAEMLNDPASEWHSS